MQIIGGKFKKKSLIIPKTDAVRPTTSKVREALFNMCQFSIEGARFLDIFAGSGAMGFEALSRGAAFVTFIERNSVALQGIKKNIASFEVTEQTRVMPMDAFKALDKLEGSQFDIIYVDPPYGEGLGKKILEILDYQNLLAPEGRLFIEERSLQAKTLSNLTLISERRFGSTRLFEFCRRDELEPPLQGKSCS